MPLTFVATARVPERVEKIAQAGELDALHEHLEAVMVQSGFLNPDHPRLLKRRLRRLFNRARLDENELNILRGILSSLAPGSGDTPPGEGR